MDRLQMSTSACFFFFLWVMKRHAEAKRKTSQLCVVLHVDESHVTTGDHVFTDDSPGILHTFRSISKPPLRSSLPSSLAPAPSVQERPLSAASCITN